MSVYGVPDSKSCKMLELATSCRPRGHSSNQETPATNTNCITPVSKVLRIQGVAKALRRRARKLEKASVDVIGIRPSSLALVILGASTDMHKIDAGQRN